MALREGFHDVPAGAVALVVTHLEMSAPPEGVPAPAPEGLSLVHRPGIAPAEYLEAFRAVGGPWMWFSREVMDEGALAAMLAAAGARGALGAAGRCEVVGLVELLFEGDACELVLFGLVPGEVGRGAGRWLMGQALARAWARPIRRLDVHTCTADHPAAMGFYLRSGFRAVRRQVEVARDPRLDGLAPEGAAPHVPLIPG